MSTATDNEDYLFCIVDDRPERKAAIITSDIHIKSFKHEDSTNDVIIEWLKKYCGLCCISLCIYIVSFLCALGIPGSIAYGGYLVVLEGVDKDNSSTKGWMIFAAVILFIVACCACACCGVAWIGTFGHEDDCGRNISGVETEWNICIKKVRGVYMNHYYHQEWRCLSKRKRLDYYLGYYSRLYEIDITDSICRIMNEYVGTGERYIKDSYVGNGSYGRGERDNRELEFNGEYYN